MLFSAGENSLANSRPGGVRKSCRERVRAGQRGSGREQRVSAAQHSAVGCHPCSCGAGGGMHVHRERCRAQKTLCVRAPAHWTHQPTGQQAEAGRPGARTSQLSSSAAHRTHVSPSRIPYPSGAACRAACHTPQPHLYALHEHLQHGDAARVAAAQAAIRVLQAQLGSHQRHCSSEGRGSIATALQGWTRDMPTARQLIGHAGSWCCLARNDRCCTQWRCPRGSRWSRAALEGLAHVPKPPSCWLHTHTPLAARP